MEDPKHDEPEAAADDVEDLELQPEETEDVKGGHMGGVSGGTRGLGGGAAGAARALAVRSAPPRARGPADARSSPTMTDELPDWLVEAVRRENPRRADEILGGLVARARAANVPLDELRPGDRIAEADLGLLGHGRRSWRRRWLLAWIGLIARQGEPREEDGQG